MSSRRTTLALALVTVSSPGVAQANSFRGLGLFVGGIGLGLPALILLLIMGAVGWRMARRGRRSGYGRALQTVSLIAPLPFPLFSLFSDGGDPESMLYTLLFAAPLVALGVICFKLGGRVAS